MKLTPQSTLAEFDAALLEGSVTLKAARALLAPRSERDTPSGHRAQAWLDAHKAPAKKAPAKAAAEKAAPKGDPQKKAAADAATALHPRGTSAWWQAYRAARAAQATKAEKVSA